MQLILKTIFNKKDSQLFTIYLYQNKKIINPKDLLMFNLKVHKKLKKLSN